MIEIGGHLYDSKRILEKILNSSDNNDRIALKLYGQKSNNIMTLDTTLNTIKILGNDKIITSDITQYLIEEESNKNVNTNGFDVQYDGDENNPKIIIEVKCLMPSHGGFMTKQWKSILSDFKNLIDPDIKKKAKLKGEKSDYYKFFAICNHTKDNEGLTVKESIEKIFIKKNFSEFVDIVLPYEENKNNLDKEHIYIMYVNL